MHANDITPTEVCYIERTGEFVLTGKFESQWYYWNPNTGTWWAHAGESWTSMSKLNEAWKKYTGQSLVKESGVLSIPLLVI